MLRGSYLLSVHKIRFLRGPAIERRAAQGNPNCRPMWVVQKNGTHGKLDRTMPMNSAWIAQTDGGSNDKSGATGVDGSLAAVGTSRYYG